MKLLASRRSRVSLGILSASLALTLYLAPKPMAQTGAQPQQSPYKFTVIDGERRTAVSVAVARNKITAVSGTNDRGTFRFTQVKAGARPKITGGSGQVLKCAKIKPGENLGWTVCAFVGAGGGGGGTEGTDYLLEIEGIKGRSPGDGVGNDGDGSGGGGGGGGTPSNCWEDEKLQMSICDP